MRKCSYLRILQRHTYHYKIISRCIDQFSCPKKLFGYVHVRGKRLKRLRYPLRSNQQTIIENTGKTCHELPWSSLEVLFHFSHLADYKDVIFFTRRVSDSYYYHNRHGQVRIRLFLLRCDLYQCDRARILSES